MYVHIENQLGFVGYDVSIARYGMVNYNGMVCQYVMMLVSQGIVGYVFYVSMVLCQYHRVLQGMIWYITHACMTQCYDVSVCNLGSVWYGYDVKKLMSHKFFL